MSQNITMPSTRVPLVDSEGRITREWTMYFLGVFERLGGLQGFSNQELAGEAAGAQDYNKLLSRIGAAEAAARGSAASDAALQDLQQRLSQLEALSRQLGNAVEIMFEGQAQPPAVPPPTPKPTTVFPTITVKGDANLATDSGAVKVRGGVAGSTAVFQVNGDAGVSGDFHADGNIGTNAGVYAQVVQSLGESRAVTFVVGGLQVVAARVSGNPAYPSYPGQSINATYAQAQVQAMDNNLRDASAVLSRLVSAMRTHGLIGD